MAGRTPTLTAATLATWLLMAGPTPAQSLEELQGYQHRLQQLFQRLDHNGDLRLERREVTGQPYLQRHFERLDQQQRGYLSPSDLLGPAAASQPAEPARSQRFFLRADRNADGLINREEAAASPWLQRRFPEADRNNDGQLSREELRQLRLSSPAAESR